MISEKLIFLFFIQNISETNIKDKTDLGKSLHKRIIFGVFTYRVDSICLTHINDMI